MEYASPVWDPHTKHNTNKIEMFHRRCASYVTGNFDRNKSVTSLPNSLNWPTLEERRRKYRLAVMHRILHNQVFIHWQSFLTNTSSCTRITPDGTSHHYVRIKFMPHLSSRTSKDWNNPIIDPADAPSIDTYIRKLRNGNA